MAQRIQVNYLAVPLGLGGMGGAWSAAIAGLGAPGWPAEVFYAASALLWATLSVTYVIERLGEPRSFRTDLENPVTGPILATIPVVGIMLVTHWAPVLGDAGPWLNSLLLVILGVLATLLLSHWLANPFSIDGLHPGYFLPLVAGPFVASIGMTAVGLPEVGVAVFGVAVFFWIVLGTIVIWRLLARGPLPDPAVPTLAVLLAPPAVGGVAWIVAHGGEVGSVGLMFAGVAVIMLALQLSLIRLYRRLRFTLNFWSFTFPVAATSNFAVRLVAPYVSVGAAVVGWSVLAITTAVVVTIAVASVVLLVRTRRTVPVSA